MLLLDIIVYQVEQLRQHKLTFKAIETTTLHQSVSIHVIKLDSVKETKDKYIKKKGK